MQTVLMRFILRLCMALVLALGTAGCGSFVARRIAQAPNTYPTWFAPHARVELGFSPKFLTNFPARFVEVGPPPARIRYRVVNPADYQVKVVSTNWTDHGKAEYRFGFTANVPGPTNAWTAAPRGTILLLHGYGDAQFTMAPWALRLAQEGWRCVLVDLRGHGKSTGKRIYFGTRETNDLSQLLDVLDRDHRLVNPVAVVGQSYGAALALRWQTVDPRVRAVVAITPYAGLSNAVLNIAREYAPWFPQTLIKSGLKKLPKVLNVPPDALDTTTVVTRHPTPTLFIAAENDKIAPPAEVKSLCTLAAHGSQFVVVPGATHEAVAYFFKDLAPPIIAWLADTNRAPAD